MFVYFRFWLTIMVESLFYVSVVYNTCVAK